MPRPRRSLNLNKVRPGRFWGAGETRAGALLALEGKAQMPTTFDQQQAEQRRIQITVEEHFITTLEGGLPDLTIRENRLKQQLELAKDPSWEHRSATTELGKLSRQRTLIEQRIAFAKGRLKVAQDRLAELEQPSLQRSGKIRELLRQ